MSFVTTFEFLYTISCACRPRFDVDSTNNDIIASVITVVTVFGISASLVYTTCGACDRLPCIVHRVEPRSSQCVEMSATSARDVLS